MRTRNLNKVSLVKETAITLIVKDGLERFSMNKLARACKISVATLYIYYKDRDDLILKVAIDEGQKMSQRMIQDFDPESPFEEGLRQQWRNRYAYMKANPLMTAFFDQLRASSYQEQFLQSFLSDFKDVVSRFMHNIISRGEVDDMPFEVYWSIAFSPLYNLIRFENEGKSIGGKAFKMTDEILWSTFNLVVKALKK
jgi:TetR/AcrR family transcriptional repressor of multidrug resistance operon